MSLKRVRLDREFWGFECPKCGYRLALNDAQQQSLGVPPLDCPECGTRMEKDAAPFRFTTEEIRDMAAK